MRMDLIERKAAIEEVDDTVTSVSVCATVEQARGAAWAKDMIREKLEKLPTIPAVPLEPLCEWLSRSALFNTGYRNKIGASMWKELIKREVMEGWKDDNA